MKVEVEGFIDAALLGRLSVSREEVLECVPGDDDEDHLGRGKCVCVCGMSSGGTYEGEDGYEIPFYFWVIFEEVDVHAEETGDEGERKKNERDP